MFNLKKEVLLGGGAFLMAFLVATTVVVMNNGQYKNLDFLKTATVAKPSVQPDFDPGMIYPAGDARGANQSYLKWTTSTDTTKLKVVCTGAFSYNDYAPLNSSEISSNGFGPFDWEDLSSKGSSVSCSFTPSNSAGNGTQYTVGLTLASAVVSNPSVTSASFSPTSISVGESSNLNWVTSGADGVYVTCKDTWSVVGDLENAKISNSTPNINPYKVFYDQLYANGYRDKITCTFIPYNDLTGGTGSSYSTSLTLADSPQPTVKVDFVEETSVAGTYNIKSEASGGAIVGETFGLWIYYTNFEPTKHKFCLLSKMNSGGVWGDVGSDYSAGTQNIVMPMRYTAPATEQISLKVLNKTSDCNMAGISSDKTEQITIHAPINGSCGSANGQSFSSAPSSNLCSTGTASSVTGSGPWTWTCSGSGSGTTASCSANKTAVVPTLKISFIKSETDKTEIITAKQNESKAVRYQLAGYDKNKYDWFFKFSLPMKINGATTPAGTWAQMPDETLPAGADMTAPFTFSTTTAGDFYAEIKIVNQGTGSAGTAVHSSQSNHVNITAGLQGDFDMDGDVDMIDYNTFVTEFQSNQGNTNSTSRADFDQDKKVSMADYNIFVTNYTGSKN